MILTDSALTTPLYIPLKLHTHKVHNHTNPKELKNLYVVCPLKNELVCCMPLYKLYRKDSYRSTIFNIKFEQKIGSQTFNCAYECICDQCNSSTSVLSLGEMLLAQQIKFSSTGGKSQLSDVICPLLKPPQFAWRNVARLTKLL